MSLCLLTKLKSKALKWTAYWEVYSSNLPKRGRSKICFVGIPDLGPRHLVNKTAICLSWLSVFSVVVCYRGGIDNWLQYSKPASVEPLLSFCLRGEGQIWKVNKGWVLVVAGCRFFSNYSTARGAVCINLHRGPSIVYIEPSGKSMHTAPPTYW